MNMNTEESFIAALTQLGDWLRLQRYEFTTVTPLTHARVLRREAPDRPDLCDIFGWNRPFREIEGMPNALARQCAEAGLLREQSGGRVAAVRFATLGSLLFAHSAFPTTAGDAVFFGPDTYRFASAIEGLLRDRPLPAAARILEIGAGAGPGGLLAARLAAAGAEVVLADINPLAVTHCKANAAVNHMPHVRAVESDVTRGVDGHFDLIVSNPPYLVDAAERTYRHGGGTWGEDLSVRIVRESLARLRPGGSLLLYTGSAVVEGVDRFREAVLPVLQETRLSYTYREIDPDVFGEELDNAAYTRADRIAAVCLTVKANGHAHPGHR